MIPDKIYTFQDDGDRYWYKPEEWETPPLTRVEYIRKDALLEWAKEQKKDCERVIREHPEDESLWCERDKYDELIDKLNSM